MKSGLLICFIGTDGSGKSTLAHNIYSRLRKNPSLHFRKVYGRHQPAISKLLILVGRSVFLKNKSMFSDYDTYLKDKRMQFHKSSRLVSLYIRLISIEYLIQTFIKISIPLKLGYNTIADRYVYDTIVNDLAVDRDLTDIEVRALLHNFWNYLPRPDFVFLIKVPEDLALARKNDIPSGSYLRVRNRLYDEICRDQDNIQILDGNMSLADLESIVLKTICPRLKEMIGHRL